MLLLLLFVLFYVVMQDKTIKVTANDLVQSYITNIKTTDENFFNKEIELTGKVKSFLQFESDKSLLELKTANDELKLYCILMNKETEEKASTLTTGTLIKVFGKCLGLKDYKYPNSIYIEAEQIR